MSQLYPCTIAHPIISVNESSFISGNAPHLDLNLPAGSRAIKEPESDPEAQQPGLTKRVLKIVIVSDDRYFCGLVRSYLESAGLSVFVCTTSERAENLFLSRSGIDLWIIDVQALGLEAVYIATRVSELNPEVPLLVIDGPRHDQVSLRSLLPGGWILLKKPVELPDLLANVHRMLAWGRRRKGNIAAQFARRRVA